MGGNLIITTVEEYSAEQLKGHMQGLKDKINFEALHVDCDWHQVVVHGVRIRGTYYDGSTYNLNSAEGLDLMKTEIQTFNKSLNLEYMGSGVNWITPYSKRSLENTFKASIIVSFKTQEQQNKTIRHGLSLLGERCKAEKAYKSSARSQCSNCQRYGHVADQCKGKTICRICSKNHPTNLHNCSQCNTKGKACIHTITKCSNCQGNHQANSRECEVRPEQRPTFQHS